MLTLSASQDALDEPPQPPLGEYDSDNSWRCGEHTSEVLNHYFAEMRPARVGILVADKKTHDQQLSDAIVRIDEIEPGLAGEANISLLCKGMPPWAKSILIYLTQSGRPLVWNTEKVEAELLERKGKPRYDHLSRLMSRAVKELAEKSNLYQRLRDFPDTSRKEDGIRHAGAFFVEKQGKTKEVVIDGKRQEVTVLRVITDARAANAHCGDNASFNLFTLDSLLQMVSNVSRLADAQGNYFVVNADLRHMFHQLPLPGRLQRLFLLSGPEGTYVPRAAPMGWKLAPLLGQTASWSMLLGNNGDLEAISGLGGGRNRTPEMPAWLPFADGDGGIFVLIDNLLIITTNKERANWWCKRMDDRGRATHLIFKQPPRVEEIRRGDASTSFTFDGIRIEFDRWRTIDRDRDIDPANPTLTYRQVSGLLGEVLWDLRVRRHEPILYADLLGVYSKATPPSHDLWDATNSRLDDTDRAILQQYVAEARKHHYRERLESWYAGRYVLYAVDARLDGEGKKPAVQMSAVVPLQLDGKVHPPWFATRHDFEIIAETELVAIIEAVEHAMQQPANPGDPLTLIIIATDSLVAKGWVERGYSDRPRAQELLKRLRRALGESGVRVACVYVPSEDNVADDPSRLNPALLESMTGSDAVIKPARLQATIRALRTATASVMHRATMSGQQAVRNPRAA